MQQETSDFRIEQFTQEGDAQRRDHDALVQDLQDLFVWEKASDDIIRELEINIERQEDRVKRLGKDLRAQQEDSVAEFKGYQVNMGGEAIAEADERFNKVQKTANERIRKLEESLDAQQKSDREAP